jgi:hypothetical protein
MLILWKCHGGNARRVRKPLIYLKNSPVALDSYYNRIAFSCARQARSSSLPMPAHSIADLPRLAVSPFDDVAT